MGASISSGSVRYVFTQAAAPSGEGEVEGSLWYDTSVKELYTYDGSSWNSVISGVPAVILGSGTLTSTTTSIELSGIASGYTWYKVILFATSEAALKSLYLRFNNDNAASAYKWENMKTINATWSNNVDTTSGAIICGDIEGTNRSSHVIDISNVAGKQKVASYTSSVLEGYFYQGTGIWTNTTDEISVITLSQQNIENFSIGTSWLIVGGK